MACGLKLRRSGCESVCALGEDWEQKEERVTSGGKVGLGAEGRARAGRRNEGALLFCGFSACGLCWVGQIQG